MTVMTPMTSWELFEDLRAVQEEMLRVNRGRAWRPGQQYDAGTGAAAWAPMVDIAERKDAYLVAADLPGVKIGDLEITFEDGLLTIQGERHFARDVAGEKVHRAERCFGAFRRSITLPSHVEADKIEASHPGRRAAGPGAQGPEVQAKRIEVRAGQGYAALTRAQRRPRTAADRSRGRAWQPPGNMKPPAVSAGTSGDGRRLTPQRAGAGGIVTARPAGSAFRRQAEVRSEGVG